MACLPMKPQATLQLVAQRSLPCTSTLQRHHSQKRTTSRRLQSNMPSRYGLRLFAHCWLNRLDIHHSSLQRASPGMHVHSLTLLANFHMDCHMPLSWHPTQCRHHSHRRSTQSIGWPSRWPSTSSRGLAPSLPLPTDSNWRMCAQSW